MRNLLALALFALALIGVGDFALADSDLNTAVHAGDAEKVHEILSQKIEEHDLKHALSIATLLGHVEIVKDLLNHGAGADAEYYGVPITYWGLRHSDVLAVLFDAGADPKAIVDYHGMGAGPQKTTLLHGAANLGAIDTATLLVDRGVQVDGRDLAEHTPLHVAISGHQAKMVKWLLEHGADIDARDQQGWTPMTTAAREFRAEKERDNDELAAIVRLLAQRGVEVDLFATIATNDIERAKEIIGREPKSVNQRRLDGLPALHFAVELDQREITKLLVDLGCDVDILCSDKDSPRHNETALLVAAFWGRLELAKLLIEQGAQVNMADADNVTPLHEAARLDHPDVTRLLLEQGANVNAAACDGQTPLDWAYLFHEDSESIDLLHKHGAIHRHNFR